MICFKEKYRNIEQDYFKICCGFLPVFLKWEALQLPPLRMCSIALDPEEILGLEGPEEILDLVINIFQHWNVTSTCIFFFPEHFNLTLYYKWVMNFYTCSVSHGNYKYFRICSHIVQQKGQ